MCFVNNSIKDILKLPRPPKKFYLDSYGDLEHTVQQYGFPSTHAAHALSLGYVLAREAHLTGFSGAVTPIGTTAAATWALLHTVHVSISRLYIGVHSTIDIVGGLLVGAICSWICASGRFEVYDDLTVSTISGQFGALAIHTVSLGFLYPDRRPENSAFSETVVFAGLYAGSCVGSGALGIAIAGPRLLHVHDYSQSDPKPELQFLFGAIIVSSIRLILSFSGKRTVAWVSSLSVTSPHRSASRSYIDLLRKYFTAMLTTWLITAVHPKYMLEILSQHFLVMQ